MNSALIIFLFFVGSPLPLLLLSRKPVGRQSSHSRRCYINANIVCLLGVAIAIDFIVFFLTSYINYREHKNSMLDATTHPRANAVDIVMNVSHNRGILSAFVIVYLSLFVSLPSTV